MHAYILTVLGLICFVEGIPYLATPDQLKKLQKWVISFSDSRLRLLGGALMIVGLILVYLGRNYGG